MPPRFTGALALLVMMLHGCDPASPPRPADVPAADDKAGPGTSGLVTVTFVDALLALSHDDGIAWDSGHVVPDLVRADLRVALVGRDPFSAVVERIVARDLEPWGKPDPIGHVTLMGSATCRRETRILPSQRDTYRPSWAPGLVWKHVALDQGTRFRVVLEDDDSPRPSELVGEVDIVSDALESALTNGGAVQRIDVSGQKQPIYFVGIRVVRE